MDKIIETVKFGTQGHVFIPVKIRKRMNLKAGDILLFQESGNDIIIRKGKVTVA